MSVPLSAGCRSGCANLRDVAPDGPGYNSSTKGDSAMPLRDRFRLPVWNQSSWEGLHGMWPASMVVQLSKVLPENFTAEPRVHLGTYFEIDVCAYEGDGPAAPQLAHGQGPGGTATAPWAPPQP